MNGTLFALMFNVFALGFAFGMGVLAIITGQSMWFIHFMIGLSNVPYIIQNSRIIGKQL